MGRWRDHRQVIDGTLHRVRTGVQWRDLPERFGGKPMDPGCLVTAPGPGVPVDGVVRRGLVLVETPRIPSQREVRVLLRDCLQSRFGTAGHASRSTEQPRDLDAYGDEGLGAV